MYIAPNNKLSNHFRKKRKVEKTVWVDDQTVSGYFQQNMETMREKTKNQMFYEDYLNPCFSFSNNYNHSIHPNLFCDSYLSSSLLFAGKCFGMNPFNEDGLSDWQEAAIYETNWRDEDCDDDGLKDGDEVNTYNTDPNNADTDNDRPLDSWNVTHEAFLL